MQVTLLDHMGDDLSVVNAARVSFGKRSEELTDKDIALLWYLARGMTTDDLFVLKTNLRQKCAVCTAEDELDKLLIEWRQTPEHWSPFAHTAVQLHVRAPIFVARQLVKHQVGLVWNEVSRRYVQDDPVLWLPPIDGWRKRGVNNKQGSSDETIYLPDHPIAYDTFLAAQHSQMAAYRALLEAGVCPEQARIVLGLNLMTEWIWTGNLYSFVNVVIQRTNPHAQKETSYVAAGIGEVLFKQFPYSYTALINSGVGVHPPAAILGDKEE